MQRQDPRKSAARVRLLLPQAAYRFVAAMKKDPLRPRTPSTRNSTLIFADVVNTAHIRVSDLTCVANFASEAIQRGRGPAWVLSQGTSGATACPSSKSSARYTSPVPPRPTRLTIRKRFAKIVPGTKPPWSEPAKLETLLRVLMMVSVLGAGDACQLSQLSRVVAPTRPIDRTKSSRPRFPQAATHNECT